MLFDIKGTEFDSEIVNVRLNITQNSRHCLRIIEIGNLWWFVEWRFSCLEIASVIANFWLLVLLMDATMHHEYLGLIGVERILIH